MDVQLLQTVTMWTIKRTVRRVGKLLGMRKGVNGTELLGYIEARKQIYIPTYKWVLENKVASIIERLRTASNEGKTIILLDYDTNADVENAKKPLSHASLIKAYVEGTYPYGDNGSDGPTEAEVSKKSKITSKKSNIQELELFNE